MRDRDGGVGTTSTSIGTASWSNVSARGRGTCPSVESSAATVLNATRHTSASKVGCNELGAEAV